MTAVVAFTFGSLGDIISLLQIANTIRTALCDTKGTSAEYRDLLAELDSLVYTVASVQRTLSVQGPDRLSQSVENGLYHAVHVCLRLLAQANERVAVLRSSTTSNLWRRVGWMLVRNDEVVTLRLRLSEQIKAINTLLTLAQGDRLDRVSDQVDRTGDQLESVQVAVRKQHALVVEIHRCVKNMPQWLGYLWEGDLDAEALPIRLKLTDKHVITVPWELCATQQLFSDFLDFYFRKPHEFKAVHCEVEPDGSIYIDGLAYVFEGDSEMVKSSVIKYFELKPGTTLHFTVLELKRNKHRPTRFRSEHWRDGQAIKQALLSAGPEQINVIYTLLTLARG